MFEMKNKVDKHFEKHDGTNGTNYKYQEYKRGFHHKSDRHKHGKKRML